MLFDHQVAFVVKILVRKCKKHKKVKKALGFIMKIVQTVLKPFLLYCFLCFLGRKSEKASRTETTTKTETFVSQKPLGNRSCWSRAARARPPARTHERNETISREGPLELKPPSLRFFARFSTISYLNGGPLFWAPRDAPRMHKRR